MSLCHSCGSSVPSATSDARPGSTWREWVMSLSADFRLSSLETRNSSLPVFLGWGSLAISIQSAGKAGNCSFHLYQGNSKQDWWVQSSSTMSDIISVFTNEKTSFKWFSQVHILRNETDPDFF